MTTAFRIATIPSPYDSDVSSDRKVGRPGGKEKYLLASRFPAMERPTPNSFPGIVCPFEPLATGVPRLSEYKSHLSKYTRDIRDSSVKK